VAAQSRLMVRGHVRMWIKGTTTEERQPYIYST
jgi:hypothetical protein